MKVAYEDSLLYKIIQHLNCLKDNVILRQDLRDLGSTRQISRALNKLVKLKKLVRLGYGVYGKLNEFKGKYFLLNGFVPTAREALDKLNVQWEFSASEKDYLLGRSTQVPVAPTTIVISSFKRKLQYNNRDFKFERKAM